MPRQTSGAPRNPELLKGVGTCTFLLLTGFQYWTFSTSAKSDNFITHTWSSKSLRTQGDVLAEQCRVKICLKTLKGSGTPRVPSSFTFYKAGEATEAPSILHTQMSTQPVMVVDSGFYSFSQHNSFSFAFSGLDLPQVEL